MSEVELVTKEHDNYLIPFKHKTVIETKQQPICATRFSLVQNPIATLLTFRDDGFPLLEEESDELYNQHSIYLSEPEVRHDSHIFCFIYKFRQRFAVIIEDILNKKMYAINNIDSLVKIWKRNGLYLFDLSCCDEECVC